METCIPMTAAVDAPAATKPASLSPRVKAEQLPNEVQKNPLNRVDRRIDLASFFTEVLMSSCRRHCDRSACGKLSFLLGWQRSDFDWVLRNDNLLISEQLLYSREYFLCLWVRAKALVQASHDGLIRWRDFGRHLACSWDEGQNDAFAGNMSNMGARIGKLGMWGKWF